MQSLVHLTTYWAGLGASVATVIHLAASPPPSTPARDDGAAVVAAARAADAETQAGDQDRSARSRTALHPVDLRCEYAVEPVGIDASPPRLFWRLTGEGRGRRQTAYQVLAGSTPERLAPGRADLWDSSRVASPETTHIDYGGSSPRSSQSVFWKVRVWDEAGQASRWSETASWTMGVLLPGDWRARWIMAPEQPGADSTPASLPIFRKSFSVTQPVRRALVHVCGLGHYELLVDGQKVGDRFLDPAWSVYEKTAHYTTYDLTEWLRPGRHAFGLMLGKGFYNTAGDRRVHGVHARRPLQLIFQAELTLTNDSRQQIVSDATWRTAPGPITHSAILGGEDFDARKVPRGWGQPDFEDDNWAGAVETDGPGGVLTASYAPPMTVQQVFPAVRIDEPEPGVFVYDFAQNASAVPRLRVRGQAGQVLRLTPAEQRHGMSPRRNDGRGLVNPAGVGHPNYWQYTLRGGTIERWTPQFNYSGFQYLQLEGAVPDGYPNPEGKPVVESLDSVHVRSDATPIGSFACSNPLFNDIDRIVDWAVRANLAHVLTDCPHREKLGWLEVSYLMGPSIAGRYGSARFYSKICRDIADSQSTDGLVPTVAPAYPAFSGGFAYTPEWGAAAVVNPWLLHDWCGDRCALENAYPTMKGFVDYMHRTSTNLVPRAGLGDWYDYGHGKPVGASQFTPVDLSAMATFYRCTDLLADAAAILGRADDHRRYAQLAREIADAFNRRYFDGSAEYRNQGSPQTANSMALTVQLVPPQRRTAVLERVIQDIRQRGNQQTAGDVGFWYLLQALAENGRSDVINDLVVRTNLGSYGFIVGNGWTSMPEAWDADTGASMNHCMLGHIQEWFLGWIAGIRPDPTGPGFRRFLIDPHPVGDLTWARGGYDSLHGRIESAWRIAAGRLELRVTVPANTTATVLLPVNSPASVRESGRPLDRVGEIQLLPPVGGEVGLTPKLALRIGSGSYKFEMTRTK